MPENEFEKQVKELMEQFHISPSAPVWEKIKKHITKKKRRIWPVFFLLVSILTVSSYFFYADVKHSNQNIKTAQQPINNTTSKQNVTQNKNSENQTTKSIAEKSNEKNSVVIEHHKKNETAFTHHQSKNNLNNDNNVTENSFIDKQPIESNNNISNNNVNTPTQTNSSQVTINNTRNNTQQTADTIANKTSVINSQPAEQNIVSANVQPGTDSSKIVANNNIDKTDTATITNKEVVVNHQTQNKKASNKKLNNNKWSFGITGMYGISNITDKITNIDVGGNKSLSQVDYLNTSGGTTSNNSVHLKNPYSTNNAYNFGVVVKRKISKKSAISTGLSFIHLSSKNTTAISVNSVLIPVVSYYQSYNAGSNFYRVGTAKTYTNNFNFIEIPITFQSNIFKIKNFSLQYDAGFSVMRVLSSKSLIYNSKNNSFFFNDDLLRRTQFQINAGLNFQLHTKAGNFLLGPKLEYSLSTYLKTNDYDKLHFINYGIRAAWLFNKK